MIDDPVFAMGPCYICKTVFPFDPQRVPSVWINPETGKILDDGADTTNPDTAMRVPLCPDDVVKINEGRKRRGLAPHWT